MPGAETSFAARLRAESLACRRGGRSLFNALTFEVGAGEALEVRGANGSGKSSLLRILAGLAPATTGTVRRTGSLARDAETEAADIAYLGHMNGLQAELTPMENLRFAQRLQCTGCRDLAGALQAWELDGFANRPMRRLSQGQQRRVALARLSLTGQRVWLLDEPCAGLDEAGEQLFDRHLAAHLAAGGLAVVATHQPLRLPATRCKQLWLGLQLSC